MTVTEKKLTITDKRNQKLRATEEESCGGRCCAIHRQCMLWLEAKIEVTPRIVAASLRGKFHSDKPGKQWSTTFAKKTQADATNKACFLEARPLHYRQNSRDSHETIMGLSKLTLLRISHGSLIMSRIISILLESHETPTRLSQDSRGTLLRVPSHKYTISVPREQHEYSSHGGLTRVSRESHETLIRP